MKVTRLPKDSGPAGWDAILPPRQPNPELRESLTSEWLVIGAGFAGLAAARRLSQLHPSDRITVLEAARIAEGPAGRNSGFMIDLPHDLASEDYGGNLEDDRKQTRLNRAGISFALDAANQYGLSDEAIVKSGKINAAATAKGMKHNTAYGTHLEKLDEVHEMLDATQMRELTGTNYYQGGLFTPHAAMIQPALFVRGVAQGLLSNRVAIHERSPVIELKHRGQDWIAKTPGGDVTAGRVILAVNGHAESFGFFPRQLIHVFTYASMTRALNDEEVRTLGGAARWAVTPADPLGTTVRRICGTGGHRIIVRNRFTCNPSMEISERQIADCGRNHDRAFRHRFPMLSGVAAEYRWGGRLCLSRNSAPAFGELQPGLFAACCQNGLGTAKGTVSGMLAADLASGIASPLLDDMLSQPSPTRLPPEPIAYLGASATIRWGEFKAGAEL
ncbi:MAG: NAD(P)/FAD-dependent oxidoreductase [Hyphomicrobiaceae bacterium]